MTEAEKEYARKIPHLPGITYDPRLDEVAKNLKPSAKLARANLVLSKIKWMDDNNNITKYTENAPKEYIVNEEEVEYVVQKKEKPE